MPGPRTAGQGLGAEIGNGVQSLLAGMWNIVVCVCLECVAVTCPVAFGP
jgi:hypothetical protein